LTVWGYDLKKNDKPSIKVNTFSLVNGKSSEQPEHINKNLYRVSQNYRIPSSGISSGHPVDQVKMFKKNCCHFEKNIKVANICLKVPD
jgi:hypothetical protein